MNDPTLTTHILPTPFSDAFHTLSREQQLTSLRIDLLRRWQNGEAPVPEQYLNSWPDLRTDPELLWVLVAQEIDLRESANEPLALEDYLQRFPQCQAQLLSRLALNASEQAQMRGEVSKDDGADPVERQTIPPFNPAQEESEVDMPPLVPAPDSSEAGAILPNDHQPDTDSPNSPSVIPVSFQLALETVDQSLAQLHAPPNDSSAQTRPATGVTGPSAGQLGGYEILSELGRGGMGVVYKAKQTSLGRLVALKMILHSAHVGSDQRERFYREAQTIAQINHPNIVGIYEIGECEGTPYFSLEFLEGGSLDGQLNGTPMASQEAAKLVETLALAIQVAHEANVVHRDLKPANVLLAVDGTPKITDFGLVKKLDEVGQTQSGAIMGTPSYMAPEQAGGKKHQIGPAADTYALGTILYECLTGRPPFRAPTALDTVLQVLSKDPVPPRHLQPALSKDLETICMRCLHKDPQRRYGSAAELAEDLRRFQEGRPIHARPVGWPERAMKWVHRCPAQAALYGIVILALLSVGPILFASRAYLQKRLKEQEAETKTLQEKEKRRELEALARQREVERERTERDKRLKAQARLDEHLNAARDAEAQRNWSQASRPLETALKVIDEEPLLADQKHDVEEWSAKVRQIQEIEIRLKTFYQHYEQARRHQVVFTGEALSTSQSQARKSVEAAFALFKVNPPDYSPPVFAEKYSRYGYTPEQKNDVRQKCVELLFILAETHAQGDSASPERANQLNQALNVLQRIVNLSGPSHGYHLRRERYVRLLAEVESQADNLQRADQERLQAKNEPPTTALDYFLRGEEAYRRSEFKTAVEAFYFALNKDPKNFWARYYQSVMYLKLKSESSETLAGYRRAAIAGLSECLRQRPDFAWGYLLRGFAYGMLGLKQSHALAQADFHKVERLLTDSRSGADPNKPAIRYGLHVNRGLVAMQLHHWDVAQQELRKATELDPHRYQAWRDLAIAQEQQGLQLQQEICLSAAQLLGIATPVTMPFAKVVPSVMAPREERYQRSPRSLFQLAINTLDNAIKSERQKQSEKSVSLVLLYRQRARLHVLLEDTEQAQKDLADSTSFADEQDPQVAEDYVQLAYLCLKQREQAKALKACEKALKLQPKLSMAYLLKGIALLNLQKSRNDIVAAIDSLQLYLQHASESESPAQKARAHRLIAKAHAKQGNHDQAILHSRRSLEYTPHAQTYVLRGESRLEKGELRSAWADFQEALARNSTLASANRGLGLVLVREGKHLEAKNRADFLVQRAANDSVALHGAAQIYAQIAKAMQERRHNVEAVLMQTRAIEAIALSLRLYPNEAQRTSFCLARILPDPLLKPLHGRREFVELANQYGKAADSERE